METEDEAVWDYSEAFKRGDIKHEAWGKLSQASIFTHLSINKEAVKKNVNILAQPKFVTKLLRSREQHKFCLHFDSKVGL